MVPTPSWKRELCTDFLLNKECCAYGKHRGTVAAAGKELACRGVWERVLINKSVRSWDFPRRILVKQDFCILAIVS